MDAQYIRANCALEQPIDIGELLSHGSTFQAPINNNDDEVDFMDTFMPGNGGVAGGGGADGGGGGAPVEEADDANGAEDIGNEPLQADTLKSPWLQKFDLFRECATRIDEFIYKRIVRPGKENTDIVPPRHARVHIRYNGYFEGQDVPFDSTYLRGAVCKYITGSPDMLPGIDQAVCTMRPGELAQFVISYQLLYGELGCPPRIGRKADALFSINLVKYDLVGDGDALNGMPEQDKRKYATVIDVVRKLHLSGMDAFQYREFAKSSQRFLNAVETLNDAQVDNESEHIEKRDLLSKLYANLAVCYNKVREHRKAVNMIAALRQLCGNDKLACKAYYHEGLAYMSLGEYEQARKSLTQAFRMEPGNVTIQAKLTELDNLIANYKQSEKQLWRRAWGNEPVTNADAPAANGELTANKRHLDKFVKEITELMNDMTVSDEIDVFRLPNGMSKEEIEIVNDLSKRFNVNLTVKENEYDIEYLLEKSKGI